MATAKTARADMANPLSYKEIVQIVLMTATGLTPMILGEPGIGKTSILKGLREALGDEEYDYIYIDTNCTSEGDLLMKIPNRETGELEDYPAAMFKINNGKKKVIMIDEFGKGSRLVKLLLTRLILERTLGDRALPEGSLVFATSNNTTDGVGDTFEDHQINRLMFLQMRKPTPTEFQLFGAAVGMTPVTMGFVEAMPSCMQSYLDDDKNTNVMIFNPRRAKREPFLSPRSLHKADTNILRHRHTMPEHLMQEALAGTVGRLAAEKLIHYMRFEKDAVHMKDIRGKADTANIAVNVAALYMSLHNFLHEVETQDDLTDCITYLKRAQHGEMMDLFYTLVYRNARTAALGFCNADIKDYYKKHREVLDRL